MRRFFRLTKILLVLFLGMAASGCAVFEGGMVPETTLPPPKKAQRKPSISYDLKDIQKYYHTVEAPAEAQHKMAVELSQVLVTSNYFSRVSQNDDKADLHLSVVFKDSASPAAMIGAVITGLSLYTIPSWATEDYDVTATVKDEHGDSKEYVLSDKATMVQWLPMVFVFPVKNFSVLPEVRKNMYRNILMRMKNDGFMTVHVPVKMSTAGP